MITGIHFVRVRTAARATVGVDGRATKEGHRWYVYAWRGGPRIATVDGGPKPRLSREMEAAARDARAKAQASDETIGGLMRDWRRSPEWQGLAQSTRNAWSTWTGRIEEKWGKTPLEVWNDPRMVGKVIAWRDAHRATPRSADEGVKVLSRLLEWGRIRARVRVNVAAGLPQLYRGADRSTIIWTDDDLAAFRRSAEQLKLPQVVDVLELAALTGFRRADLAAVTFAEVVGGSFGEDGRFTIRPHAIVRTALKRSRGRRRRASVPILPELAELLERLRARPRKPGVDTLLVNSFGRPWGSPVSLGDRFQQVRDHAGIVDPANPALDQPERNKHLHDLRGTFVTRLCRAGLTDEEIAGIVAWSPQNVAEIRRRYVDDAAVVVAIGKRLTAAKL